ncbi:MAG: trehalose-phosphatase [Nocardioides sp.]|nr:trehalose-phosphatase [Nocardioides sp.]
MRLTSADARAHLDAVLAVLAETVVGLDFDGTLAPVVDDPAAARIHDDAPAVLADLAEAVRAVGIITGRPARQAVAMGDLDTLGPVMHERGAELFVLGQYGNERWSAGSSRIVSPRPPAGLASFERELPAVLAAADAADAFIEHKGLAVAVHTRRMSDPEAALARVSGPVGDLAARHGLDVEPGRNVIEVRSSAMHKGIALRTLVEEQGAGGVVFVGDDLGDVEAFEAVRELRTAGLPGVTVCSASEEQPALVDLADVVVDGPDGVMDFLRTLASTPGR